MKMTVQVISATEFPMDVVSMAAGTCYGKDNISYNRVKTCFKADHMSVFEHASITFKVEGVSRACLAQITRHRLASFCVESQRYCKYDFSGEDWYITPPEIKSDSELIDKFKNTVHRCADEYHEALEFGVRPEDARFMLPEATKTNFVVTMNVRELFHFFDMRIDKAAQWEIRELAREMLEAASRVNDQWGTIIDLYETHGELR